MSFTKLIKSNVWVVGVTGIALLGLLFATWVILSPVAAPNTHVESTTSVMHASILSNLDGEWTTASNGVVIDATVQNNTITIQLKYNDTTVTYWKGTFISDAHPGQQIASIKDTTQAIFNASASKIFTIGDGTISYDMSAMGVTKTAVLSRV